MNMKESIKIVTPIQKLAPLNWLLFISSQSVSAQIPDLDTKVYAKEVYSAGDSRYKVKRFAPQYFIDHAKHFEENLTTHPNTPIWTIAPLNALKQIKILFGFLFILLTFTQGFSQEKESEQEKTDLIEDFEGEEDLAKAAQNPVGDLISVPFQNNTNFGIGTYDRTQNVLNIQPVIPISLGSEWNLITRTIFPVITQPDFFSESGSTTGLGDISFTAFLSPAKPGKFIWGVGPAVIMPSATETNLGSGKWSMGPSLVGLTMKGHWVIGMIMSQVWSFAGQSDQADVNFFLAQYFVNYNMDHGYYLTSAPIITSNWNASSGNQWTVPFGAGAGKIFRLGKQPMNFNMAAYYNIIKPDFGPDWQLRFQLQFMFPK